jgi:hypothetical protein
MMTLDDFNQSRFSLPLYNTRYLVDSAQNTIFEFFENGGSDRSVEKAIGEFTGLFIQSLLPREFSSKQALEQIVEANNENAFRSVIKRAFFIVFNALEAAKQLQFAREFVKLFSESIQTQNLSSPWGNRLKTWLKNFIQSEDYQEISLFVSPEDKPARADWTQRYAIYLLVSQSMDLSNPVEQREAARARSQQLKEQFKLNLALYVARAQSLQNALNQNTISNPTHLGDRALYFVKSILLRRCQFSEEHLAHRFLQQTQNQTYADFKPNFLKYVTLVLGTPEIVAAIAKQLAEKLKYLYLENDRDRLNNALLLRTCKQAIDTLLFDKYQGMPRLLMSFVPQEPLTFVRLLVRILLICPPSRTHLEYRIANLIQLYARSPETDCLWFVNFLEALNIALAIYTENVKYNLIKIKADTPENNSVIDLNAYRVFSHYQGALPVEGC